MQPLLEHLPYHLDAMEWKWLNLDNQISHHSLGHWMPFHDIPTVLWHLIHNHLLYSLNMAWWFTQSLIPPLKKWHAILNIQPLGYSTSIPIGISTSTDLPGTFRQEELGEVVACMCIVKPPALGMAVLGGAWWCHGATVKVLVVPWDSHGTFGHYREWDFL